MIKQFMIFAGVGALSAGVYFISFSILWSGLDLNKDLSLLLAYSLSVFAHFIGNKQITFSGSQASTKIQIPKYLTVLIMNYGLTWIVFKWVTEGLQASPYLAIALSILLTMISGYYLSRSWVFR